MHILIQDPASLDAFVKRVAPHTKLPATRLKSAIAKAFSFSHIGGFESALTAPCSPADPHAPGRVDAADWDVLQELRDWLSDNVDGGSAICFDNDGHVESEQVLYALNRMMNSVKLCTIAPSRPAAVDIAQECLTRFEVDDEDALTIEHFEQSEDALCSRVVDLTSATQLHQALHLLRTSGFTDVCSMIEDLSLLSQCHEYLKKTV